MFRAIAKCSIPLAALLAIADALAASTQPDIVYLNRCPDTCPLSPGTDDAVLRKSSLLGVSKVAPAFPGTDSVFDDVAACVRHTLLPFNVHVVANSPGTTPRREIIFTTDATTLGLSPGTPAIAPYDGVAHDNIIGFVFADAFVSNVVDQLCDATAQLLGALYGIEQVKDNCPDIEDPATGCGEKAFTNTASTCGGQFTGNPGHCLLGNTTQNSYASILAVASPTDFILVNSFEGFEVPHGGPAP